MASNDVMRMKQEILQTTSTRGWRYVMTLAEASVMKLERDAIDEEDDTRGNALRREAKAARKFLTDFTSRVNIACTVSDEPGHDDFLEICM